MIQPIVKINKKKKKAQREKIVMGFIYLILAFAIIVLLFTAKSMFFPTGAASIEAQQKQLGNPMGQRLTRMSLTAFDIDLAKQFMDKDRDGKCDACGMSVELCMDSGQLQCNMDSKSTIGVLGSQHIHADWKIYINGKPFDLLPYGDLHEKQMMGDKSITETSAFIHIHPAPAPEKTGDVLHMHATGAPLWIFFGSIGLELPSEMKAYVNGEEISDYSDYVFEDLDKILITDGKGDLQKQLDSVTDYAKNH